MGIHREYTLVGQWLGEKRWKQNPTTENTNLKKEEKTSPVTRSIHLCKAGTQNSYKV